MDEGIEIVVLVEAVDGVLPADKGQGQDNVGISCGFVRDEGPQAACLNTQVIQDKLASQVDLLGVLVKVGEELAGDSCIDNSLCPAWRNPASGSSKRKMTETWVRFSDWRVPGHVRPRGISAGRAADAARPLPRHE